MADEDDQAPQEERDPVPQRAPWTIKSVSRKTRDLVLEAAASRGEPVGAWLERVARAPSPGSGGAEDADRSQRASWQIKGVLVEVREASVLRSLPDFKDVEAEDRAMTLALEHPDRTWAVVSWLPGPTCPPRRGWCAHITRRWTGATTVACTRPPRPWRSATRSRRPCCTAAWWKACSATARLASMGMPRATCVPALL